MEPAAAARIPGILAPSYEILMKTEEGRAIMKRIRVDCGICKGTKYYSIHRGITRVASVIACENCRQFYQKLKRTPLALDCVSRNKGSCYKDSSFMKTRCKACWLMQLLDCCPHPINTYEKLARYLSEDCKRGIRGIPLLPHDFEDENKGSLALEIYKDGDWVNAPSNESVDNFFVQNDDESMDVDVEGDQNSGSSKDLFETKESEIENAKTINLDNDENNAYSVVDQEENNSEEQFQSLRIANVTGDTGIDIDCEDEEALVDDPDSPDLDDILPGRTAKSSERIKRKRKRVEYFTKPAPGRKVRGPIHGPDGKIAKTGRDLCDCLQSECPGCHFPCPKCRSPKCGNDCRVNRRWYYEKVEVEGTKISWINRFVPKI